MVALYAARLRVRRDEDCTKGMMLKFVCRSLDLHPELIGFLDQARTERHVEVVGVGRELFCRLFARDSVPTWLASLGSA